MKFSNLKLTTPYLRLPAVFYDTVEPTPLDEPYVIALSKDAARLLGIHECDEITAFMNGEKYLEGSNPFAMCYAGHQFGYFVPRLGDGRAINLGKVNGYNLQLKGAGKTLYSRQGDGRAVLRSSIREFLLSEAMHGLGIPTSRALALMGSNTDVARERWEKGAVVLRLSPTWVRFGSFEYFYYNNMHDKLATLADHVLHESFPELVGVEDSYLKMFEIIVIRTAKLLAQWQVVGFNHGVMNTDNMSIDGRTIDYGPFAFLDEYDFHYICNHTDHEGRYSFGNQPSVAYWNLNMLAKALSPIVDHDAMIKALATFNATFEKEYLERFYAKLGLFQSKEDDLPLLRWLLKIMQDQGVEYTTFFRTLSHYDGDKGPLLAIVSLPERLYEWLERYDTRLLEEQSDLQERHQAMKKVNPKYILSNHLLQEAIEKAEKGNFVMVNEMLTVALNPFEEHKELEYLTKPVPKTTKNIKLSCSS